MATVVFRRSVLAFLVLFCASSNALAQSPRRLLERQQGQSAQTRGSSVAAVRHASVRVDTRALSADRLELTLLDDVRVIARRTSRSHARPGSTVWHGRLEAPDRGEVTLAVVDDALAGSVTMDGRMFEIVSGVGGLHEIRELNPALFPTEDPPLDPVESSGGTTSPAAAADSSGEIDVMVVWTAAARNRNGGTAAGIQSLVDLAVANANAAYANSQIATRLRLVYSGEVGFAETGSSIGTDLSRLVEQSDGYIDEVHTLRDRYGSDIVTLLGAGYADGGACGIGYIMSAVSTSFARYAFNVVDQSCAAGHLSYAHEVGHNQGLQHDPANAGASPAYPFAYGYQDPGGAFRTVMAYGGAPRVPQFSNPNVFYAGRPTGTAAQDNARALNTTAATVANFRSLTAPPSCAYAISPTSLAFDENGGTATISVTTASGCVWTTEAGESWVDVGPGGSGPGSVTVSAAPNSGGQRSATVTVAGQSVSIHQAGATSSPSPSCTYVASPTSITVPAVGATVEVLVTTTPDCTWSATSHTGWLRVTGGGAGAGLATLEIGASKRSRTATATVAGHLVTIAQTGAKNNSR